MTDVPISVCLSGKIRTYGSPKCIYFIIKHLKYDSQIFFTQKKFKSPYANTIYFPLCEYFSLFNLKIIVPTVHTFAMLHSAFGPLLFKNSGSACLWLDCHGPSHSILTEPNIQTVKVTDASTILYVNESFCLDYGLGTY